MVAEFQHLHDSRSPYNTPGRGHVARRVNDYDGVYLQVKTVAMNLICSESARWWLSSGIRNIPEAPIAPLGRPITLNIYKPIRFQWTWFGMNPPNGCWVTGSAKCEDALLRPWARPCVPMGKWRWRCTFTAKADSKELDLEWISSVADELWRPWGLGRMNGRMAGWTNGRTAIRQQTLCFSFREGGGQKFPVERLRSDDV